MTEKTMPTILRTEVRSNNTAESCYVTIGTRVYDVTPFIDDHPGGRNLILEHGGQDVEEVMKDGLSHYHSEAAYEILDEYLVGFVATEEVLDMVPPSQKSSGISMSPKPGGDLEKVTQNGSNTGNIKNIAIGNERGDKHTVYAATGMSSAEDLSKETDVVSDYRTHKFLDLNRPLLMQVWNGGFSKDIYLEQVHRPRHYKGGESAPLFGNFLEPLSKTAWWVVPTIWLPPVLYGTWLSIQGLPSIFQLVAYWVAGLCIWTLVEYCLHRFLFHMDYYLPDNRLGITMHFLLHGIHHYLPMDKYRLVMPPVLFLALATPFWKLAHFIFFYNWYAAIAVYCGGIFGYICYDLTHYFLHHRNLPAYWRQLKKYHLEHHFADYQNGFGVTSRFWDWVFNTEINLPLPKVTKTA